LTRTVYEADAPEEEDRRWRRCRSDGAEDGAEPEGEDGGVCFGGR
jgi:hypothetical protein